MDGNKRKSSDAEDDEVLAVSCSMLTVFQPSGIKNWFQMASEIAKLRTTAPPAHYTMKIESFSKLADVLKKTKCEKYESGIFEAGGHTWKLLLYPTGNQSRSGNDHISLYLAIDQTNALAPGWTVNVVFKFFVYDWIRQEYLTVQDGKVRLYHSLQTEHGFDQMLPQGKFCDSSNGFLVSDCCAFGAEVYVIKGSSKTETFSILDDPEDGSFTWEIEKFSTLKEKLVSQEFIVGPCSWKLVVHPKGNCRTEGKTVSLFLELHNNNFDQQPRVSAEFQLLIKDRVFQMHRASAVTNCWFDSKATSWGFHKFITLSDLQNLLKGFLVNDTLVVEAKISRISVVQASIDNVPKKR